MALHELLSRGDIMARVGIARDVMTFWIRGDVLRPVDAPARDGKRLRFPWYEANIAAIMNQLRILGVKIDGMLSIGRVYREAIAYFDKLELDRNGVRALWSVLIMFDDIVAERTEWHKLQGLIRSPGFDHKKNKRIVAAAADYSIERRFQDALAAVNSSADVSKRVTLKVLDAWQSLNHEDFRRHLDPYLTVTEQPGPGESGLDRAHPEEMTYFWRTGEGQHYRFKWGAEAGDLARKDGVTTMIAVDVTAVLYKVWNFQEREHKGRAG